MAALQLLTGAASVWMSVQHTIDMRTDYCKLMHKRDVKK